MVVVGFFILFANWHIKQCITVYVSCGKIVTLRHLRKNFSLNRNKLFYNSLGELDVNSLNTFTVNFPLCNIIDLSYKNLISWICMTVYPVYACNKKGAILAK